MNINVKINFPWFAPDTKDVFQPTHFKEQILNSINCEVRKPLMHQGLGVKLHTIRRIKHKPRFREDMKLVLQTGSRFKPKPFAETKCTGVQYLKMATYFKSGGLSLGIWLQEQAALPMLLKLETVERLAKNDGFTSTEDFYKWFLLEVITKGPGDYQVVHWTGVRY